MLEMIRYAATVLFFTAILASLSGVEAATEYDGRPNNPYGVQMGICGAGFSDMATVLFRKASELTGEWGHVRVGSGVHGLDMQGAVRTLALCRANKLIPVMTGLHVPMEYRDPDGGGDAEPFLRLDGYPLAAAHYRSWARAMAELGAKPPYFEVGNEINGKWNPETYGHWIIAISRALKSELPDLKVVSAGLAGSGKEFLDEMLTAVPEAADHIDCWGLHPYGANHPPAYDKDDYCLRGYEWTACVLAKHGITDPRFVMTESGYEIGNKADTNYPRITDELRAEYLVEAYRDYWVPDPRVVTLTLFIFQATTWPGWDGWTLLRTDFTPTRTMEALAAVPKPEGSDWMPGGPGVITGTVHDSDDGLGLERVIVYTVPGVYAAVTDEDGRFTIGNLPEGRYEVRVSRDGFVDPEPSLVTVRRRRPVHVAATMTRRGILPRNMNGTGHVAEGWNAIDSALSGHYAVDPHVGRTSAESQKLAARPGEPVGIWKCTDYNTALPDRHYSGEVWVRGRGVRLGEGEGITMTISITDPFATPYSNARVTLPLEGDFDWTPMSATIAPYAIGRRLTMNIRFDAEEGEIWLDDPYLHYAHYPVPSREELFGDREGTASIRGELMAATQERQRNAIVALNPGGFWTGTLSDGRYEIGAIPAGTYQLSAFSMGWDAAGPYEVTLAEGESIRMDLELPWAPAPRKVANPGFEEFGAEQDVVPGWIRWGEFDGIAAAGWHSEVPGMPEGAQPRSGKRFAGSIAGSNVKNGGIYQILEVEPGSTYEAGVWSKTYQIKACGDIGEIGDVANRLGVDPTGETDPNGPYVLWTPFRPSHDEWTRLTVKARAVSPRMTIFLEARQVYGLMYNLNMFDDVTFMKVPFDLPAPQVLARTEPFRMEGTRREVFEPRHLWGFTAPGDDPNTFHEHTDDLGPYREIRDEWIRRSGATLVGIRVSWKDAEPERLPEGSAAFDWKALDEKVGSIPPRMAAICRFDLDAPWAGRLEQSDEEEYWRLASRFMEHASRRLHAQGVRYYGTPGNEPSLTGRPDWAEWYMAPVRRISRAVKRGHPDNQVMAGALVVGDRPRIEALYAHGFKEHVDILDIHAYANSPGERRYNVGLSQVVESRQVLEEHGDGHKRIFLGEGYSIFPLPPHIDHLKEPPVYTDEDIEHYRRAVVYGYRALTTPREGEYDPDWLLGASFFCLNDLWGSLSWHKRATIEVDEHGDPAFWHLDGYRFPYHPRMMDPHFRTWGLIDIEGFPKGDIVGSFPPYIPKHRIEARFAEPAPDAVIPGRPYRIEVILANDEPEPFSRTCFSMDVFRGAAESVVLEALEPDPPDDLPPGESRTHPFTMRVRPGQEGRSFTVQGGCEFHWQGKSYYGDGWLHFRVGSAGRFSAAPYDGMARSTDGVVTVDFRLVDQTGDALPERLRLNVPDELLAEQTGRAEGSDTRDYAVVIGKRDVSEGGFFEIEADAGPKFETIRIHVAFPRPGRVPAEIPARGVLVNGGFEEFGPGSGFEGWDGPPGNWNAPEISGAPPGGGGRMIQKAWHGNAYRHENSQAVLVPESFRAGDTVTASVWAKGIAPVEATDHDAVRFRISIVFQDADGRDLRRDDSDLFRGTGEWKHLALSCVGAPEGTRQVRLILMHENTSDHDWHMAFLDNAAIEF